MTGFVATRNTCFALISAIEDDFRALILALGATSTVVSLLPSDVKDSALKRRAADLRMDAISSNVEDADLLPYIDFGDIAKILNSKNLNASESHKPWLIDVAKELASLINARNRVCHTRPLDAGDLPQLLDFSRRLTSSTCPFPFQSVNNSLLKLGNDPAFVLTLQIPSYWTEKSRIHHNLPLPEFDDTGFVGRQTDRINVLRLLKSHYPIVTLVGEGGIGKTALALRCLYDILDETSTTYDAIIWVSLKSAVLTSAGVRNIAGAITSTLGLLSSVATQLGSPASNIERSEAALIDEISEYLNLYKIIVAVDNLETISAGPLRELMLRVPAQSKIFLTSRVGVGEFEARYPLEGLEEKASVALFRAYARILGVDAFQRLDEGNIKGYCRGFFYNPLLIKWFVASVARGAEPANLVNKDGETFSSALSFCFQNLFDRLGISEREVISGLASARKPLTSAEIHFLMPELSSLDIEFALSALHNSSIVLRSKNGSEGLEYSLSESAQAFIGKNAPPNQIFFKRIQDRLRELRLILTKESILEARYEYDPFFVRTGAGRDERICATYLRRALDHLRRSDYVAAQEEVEEAKKLTSQSGEVWRISALVEETSGAHYKAVEDYEHSIGLDPSSRITRYCFGMFLMSDMDDLEGALSQFSAVEALDSSAAPVLTAKAMALNRMGRFEDSATLHEALLPTLKYRERRWRLTGADQAADCYRRWAHRCWEHKEFAEAEAKFRRAAEILLESSERGDVDEKLLQRTARLLKEAFSKREFLTNSALCEYLIFTAERILALSNEGRIPISEEMAWALRSPDISEADRGRLARLDRSLSGSSLTSSLEVSRPPVEVADHFGVIHNIPPGKQFGFIECNDGSRWFFHQNFLKVGTVWERLKIGSQVAFAVGQNSKGLCAINVQEIVSVVT